MPFLPFEAVDSSGKTITGTLQAASAQELEAILRQKGLHPVRIGLTVLAGQPQQAAQPMMQTQPQQRPQPRQSVERRVNPTPVVPPSPIAKPQPAAQVTAKTPELSSKDTILLYAQFASFFRSGFSPSQMIQHTTSRMPEKYRVMFREMEAEVAGGMALSESMARRPRTFYPDVIGTVKSGETSGQMAEAFELLSRHGERARAFNRPLFYFFFMFPILLLCGIGGIGMQKASLATIKAQDEAGGSLPAVQALVHQVVGQLPHDFLNGLLVALGFLALIKILYSYPFRTLRHKLGSMLPLAHGRARSEAAERFTWCMSSMLKGGASPSAAVHNAASSIPNLAIREKALGSIGVARENESLSQILQRADILAPEYVNIVQNGEMVGDPATALTHVMNAETEQFTSKTQYVKAGVTGGTLAIMAIFTLLMVVFLYKMYATGIIKMMMEQ